MSERLNPQLIDGVGTPQVMLTLESSSEYVYQSETKRSSDQTGESGTAVQQREDSEQTIVMVEGDNGEKQALIDPDRADP